jgi:tetratricopeptide (TPR) repeat protein
MDWNRIRDLKSRGFDLKDQERYQDAIKSFRDVQGILDEEHASPKRKAMNLNYIAFLAYLARDLEQAEQAARDYLTTYEPFLSPGQDIRSVSIPDDPHPAESLGTYYGMLAGILAERRKFEEAEPYAERSLECFLASGIHNDNSPFILSRKGILSRIRNRDTNPYFDKR